jgi:hypothetical protein
MLLPRGERQARKGRRVRAVSVSCMTLTDTTMCEMVKMKTPGHLCVQTRNRDVAEQPRFELAVTQPGADRPILWPQTQPQPLVIQTRADSFEHGLPRARQSVYNCGSWRRFNRELGCIVVLYMSAGLDRCTSCWKARGQSGSCPAMQLRHSDIVSRYAKRACVTRYSILSSP